MGIFHAKSSILLMSSLLHILYYLLNRQKVFEFGTYKVRNRTIMKNHLHSISNNLKIIYLYLVNIFNGYKSKKSLYE